MQLHNGNIFDDGRSFYIREKDHGKSYLKADFEAGAKAEAEAKMVAKQNAVFILIYYLTRIVRTIVRDDAVCLLILQNF
jgi:hypothetical protein